MRYEIIRKGEKFVLKRCKECGDEWYAKRKQNRCALCGGGLLVLNKDNYDQPTPFSKTDALCAQLAGIL